jgi:hypothetical protein
MAIRSGISTLLLLLAIAANSPGIAHARAKTDLVYLTNGDRLTGEIKQLDRGILQLKTDGLSTVNIEWADVDSVNSVYHFRVEDRIGDKFIGSVFVRRDGIMEIIGEGRVRTVHADSVVSMVQIDASIWEQLDGSVSLGFSYTKAQDQTQLTFGAWVQRRTTLRKTRLDLSSTVSRTAAAGKTVRYDASLDHQRLLRNVLFAQAVGTMQRNDELGLDLRSSVAVGMGANAIQSNRTLLVLAAGVSFNREWANDGTQSDNVEGVIGIEHAIFTYNFPKTDYSTEVAFYPSLTDWGRIRLDLDLRARREIVSNFYLELTYYESYDNRPPGGGEKTDYGLTFGLSWTF